MTLDTVQAFLAQHDEMVNMEQDDSDDDILMSLANQAKTMVAHVGICKERAERTICMLGLTNEEFLSLTDSGADTSILGQGWAILAIQPNRKAHVYGFDTAVAQKRNLDIGVGVCAVDLEGETILLQVNEAILNPTLQHTLLAEYQMRDYGVEVDSVAMRHGGRHCCGAKSG